MKVSLVSPSLLERNTERYSQLLLVERSHTNVIPLIASSKNGVFILFYCCLRHGRYVCLDFPWQVILSYNIPIRPLKLGWHRSREHAIEYHLKILWPYTLSVHLYISVHIYVSHGFFFPWLIPNTTRSLGLRLHPSPLRWPKCCRKQSNPWWALRYIQCINQVFWCLGHWQIGSWVLGSVGRGEENLRHSTEMKPKVVSTSRFAVYHEISWYITLSHITVVISFEVCVYIYIYYIYIHVVKLSQVWPKIQHHPWE
jgi:hypothetical protein